MLKDLIRILQSQLFAGGFLLMMTGSVIAILKDVPKKLYTLLTHQFTSTVKITDESSSAFLAIASWTQEQRFFHKVRHTDVRKFKNDRHQEEVVFIPAPGSHWFFYKWHLMWFKFERTEGKGGFEIGTKYNENFTLGMLGRNKQFLKDIVQSSTEELKKQSFGSYLKVWDYYWENVIGYAPRFLDSVILPSQEKQSLVEDIQRFLNSEKKYTLSGTPYRRGYLLYGLPGTGKTSLIAGLSNFFKKNVYLVQPQHMSDEKLGKAISEIPPHSVVVIEDVDCVTAAKHRNKKKDEKDRPLGVTLSGLLNCLDGLKVSHGLLFFLTTNHVEKLDPALIRPGRVDFRLKFKHATKEQKTEYFQKFLNLSVPPAVENRTMTMAEVQQEALTLYDKEKA